MKLTEYRKIKGLSWKLTYCVAPNYWNISQLASKRQLLLFVLVEA